MLEMNFDQALKAALFADLEKEYGHLLDSEFAVPAHSKKYLRFEKKILRDPMGYVHQCKNPIWRTVLQKVALIIIAITVFIGLIMSIPPVRAFVFSVIEELVGYDKHITEEIRPDGVVQDYDIGYLPDGFIEQDNYNGMKFYTDGEHSISFIYDYTNVSGGVLLDSDYMYSGPVVIGTNSGSLYESTVDNRKNYILWYDTRENVYFLLMSNLDVDELIKVAESVGPAE